MRGVKLEKNSKIYILSPRGVRTGGPTLLHQLASAIVKICSGSSEEETIEPEICYYDANLKNAPDDAYCEYHIKTTSRPIDEPQNVLIAPEGVTESLSHFSRIQKVIWWMSVDNYVSSLANAYLNYYNNHNFTVSITRSFNFTGGEDIFHFVQSRYALNFLRANKVKMNKICYVSDYLHPIFLKKANEVNIADKEPIVAYNPAKGAEFTKKIMKLAPHIKFVPIENMTAEEVEKLLARAMVYIDFGNHPGKDRIPREAAISSCVVITGKYGAAANNEDIPIDAEFKFNDDEREIPNIIKKIDDVFADFPKHHARFEKYREIIIKEPEKFEKDVTKAFNLQGVKEYTFAAMVQSGARGRFLRQVISGNKSLKAVYRCGEEGNEDLEDIEKISLEDAVFLYCEKRIEKFVAVSVNKAEKETITNKLTLAGVYKDDIIFVEIER